MMTKDHRRRWEYVLRMDNIDPGMLEHTLHWTIAKCNSWNLLWQGPQTGGRLDLGVSFLYLTREGKQ